MGRRRWLLGGALIAVGVLVLAAGAGWYARSGIVRWLIVRQLEQVTKRRATIERLDVDPVRGRLTIENLRLADRAPDSPLAALDRLDVRFEPGPLLRGDVRVREATVAGVRLRIVRSEGGELNIADLLTGRPGSTGSMPLTIDRLSLAGGTVSVEDRTRSPAHTWRAEEIALDVNGVSLQRQDASGSGTLRASIDGAPVSVEVSELGFAPLRLRGRMTARDVDATLAGMLLPPGVTAVLERARVSADLSAQLDDDGVRLGGSGRLDELAVRDRNGNPLLTVPSLAFTVDGAGIDPAGRTPRPGRIAVTGQATVFAAGGASSERLDIAPLHLDIAETAGASPPAARMTLTAGLPEGGRLEVEGPLRLAPIGAELRVRISRLSPGVLASHAGGPLRLAGLVDGDFTADLAAGDRFSASVRGRATLTRAAVAGSGQQVAVARQIDVEGIDAQWPRIGIARIRVAQPVAVVERDRTGRVPLAALLAASREGAPASAGAAPGSDLAVEIGDVAVEDGTVTLDDAVAQPPARLTFSKVRVAFRNVEWPPRNPATLEVQLATPGTGTLEAKGTISLEPLRLDVRARLAGAALAPYQGYVPLPARLQGQAEADLAISGSLAPRVDIAARGTGGFTELALAEGDRPLLSVRRIETSGVEYTWPATLRVDRLSVRGSRLRVVRRPDGTFPLRTLLAPPPQEDSAAPRGAEGAVPPISVAIREAILEDGRARIVDEAARPASTLDLTDVRLVARGFAWPPRDPFPIEFQMRTPDGGGAEARGSLDLARAAADAKVLLSGIDLKAAQPYVPVQGRIAGRLGADLQMQGRLEPLSIAARGTASVADAAILHGDRRIVAAERVELAGLDYAWPATVGIDRIRVQGPRAEIERQADGAFPLLALLGPPAAPATAAGDGTAAPPLSLAVGEAIVEGGAATVTDATLKPAGRVELTAIRLAARDLTWPSRSSAPLELRATAPGAGIISGTGQLRQGFTGLDLDVVLDAVDIASAGPYLPVRGRVAGKASARLAVAATREPMAVTARGTAALADLSVGAADRPLLTAARSQATGLDYAWPATITIDQLHVEKPWALVDRISGKLPVLEALDLGAGAGPTAPAGRRPQPAASAPDVGLRLTVRRATIEGGAATIVDDSVRPPGRLEIAGARAVLAGLAWPASGPTDVTLRASLPGAGSVEAQGQIRLDRATIDTRVSLDDLDLASLQPVIPVRARIGGKVGAGLRITGSLVPLALTASGQMAVSDATLGDGHRSLVQAKRVDLAGVTAEWPRRRAVIQRVDVREPWALVERDARGGLPLLDLISPKDGGTSGSPAPAAAASGPPPGEASAPHIEIGTLGVAEGFVRFNDQTTTPAFVEEVSRLAVTARALSTEPSARSEIAVAARLTGGAQVDLRGTMGPLGGPIFADAQGHLSGLSLPRVNPYVNSLLGWVARRGSVSATTKFRIRDDRLEAETEVVIGQPQFVPSRRGDEVRERVGIPLDLLVSLLENTRREVRLSVPVTGTLSSREFDFGDAVWEAIRKAAINVLALPVSWVGKIFYTADARIDTIAIWPVYFEPGTTRLQKGFDAHAERLAEFMGRTPAIVYALKPVMTVADVDALKRDALRQRIDALARESGASDPTGVARRLFAERFPDRPAPDLEAMLGELVKHEPSPDAALRALATSRLTLTRTGLESKGVDGTRLRTSEGEIPVEATGTGRVEFEMIADPREAAS